MLSPLDDDEIFEAILEHSSPTINTNEFDDFDHDHLPTSPKTALNEDGLVTYEEEMSTQDDGGDQFDDLTENKSIAKDEAQNPLAIFLKDGEQILLDEILPSTNDETIDFENVPIIMIPEGVDAANYLDQALGDNQHNSNLTKDKNNAGCFSEEAEEDQAINAREIVQQEASDINEEVELPDIIEESDPEFNVDDIFDSSSDEENVPFNTEDGTETRRDSHQDNTSDVAQLQGRQENEEEPLLLPEPKRKRNNRANWKTNLNKKLRMDGKPYLGYRRTKDGKIFYDQDRVERKMGPHCNSKMCQKSKNRHCFNFTSEQRKSIFNNFWSKMNWEQRKVYLVNMVIKTVVKRKTTGCAGNESRRSDTLQYFLNVDGNKKQVCQKMFLHTLGIKTWTVRYWVSGDKYNGNTPLDDSTSLGMAPNSVVTKRPRTGVKKRKQASECLNKFLSDLPKMPSHYSRKESSKLYIEPIFESINHFYSVYKDHCTTLEENDGMEKGSYVLSRFTFDKTFKNMNLSIFQLKKDRCDLCCSYEVGNVSEVDYKAHIESKEAARLEKSADKEKAIRKEIHAFTSDVEAVKVSPHLNASALYYKTKLVVHNFSMYNLGTKEVDCYWFDETEGDLEASVFASCVVKKLEEVLTKEPKPVVLWSDGCGNQNRNCIFSNALLHLAAKMNVQIEQKFLVKGHTQMECDSVHSNIEAKLKNREIYLPSQYHSITKDARQKPFPYESHYLTHSFFRNFSKPETMVYSSIRPGRVAGDATVHDIKSILYKPDITILTKNKLSEVYKELPRRPKKDVVGCSFPPLFLERRKIPLTKFKHLQELKFVLPADCHQFYDNLRKE